MLMLKQDIAGFLDVENNITWGYMIRWFMDLWRRPNPNSDGSMNNRLMGKKKIVPWITTQPFLPCHHNCVTLESQFCGIRGMIFCHFTIFCHFCHNFVNCIKLCIVTEFIQQLCRCFISILIKIDSTLDWNYINRKMMVTTWKFIQLKKMCSSEFFSIHYAKKCLDLSFLTDPISFT